MQPKASSGADARIGPRMRVLPAGRIDEELAQLGRHCTGAANSPSVLSRNVKLAKESGTTLRPVTVSSAGPLLRHTLPIPFSSRAVSLCPLIWNYATEGTI